MISLIFRVPWNCRSCLYPVSSSGECGILLEQCCLSELILVLQFYFWEVLSLKSRRFTWFSFIQYVFLRWFVVEQAREFLDLHLVNCGFDRSLLMNTLPTVELRIFHGCPDTRFAPFLLWLRVFPFLFLLFLIAYGGMTTDDNPVARSLSRSLCLSLSFSPWMPGYKFAPFLIWFSVFAFCFRYSEGGMTTDDDSVDLGLSLSFSLPNYFEVILMLRGRTDSQPMMVADNSGRRFSIHFLLDNCQLLNKNHSWPARLKENIQFSCGLEEFLTEIFQVSSWLIKVCAPPSLPPSLPPHATCLPWMSLNSAVNPERTFLILAQISLLWIQKEQFSSSLSTFICLPAWLLLS